MLGVGLYVSRPLFQLGKIATLFCLGGIVCICSKSTVDITEAGLEPALPHAYASALSAYKRFLNSVRTLL